LFSSVFSSFIHKFLSVYISLKRRLNFLSFKIVFFKILFLKKNKVIVLVDVYRLLKKLNFKRFFSKRNSFPQNSNRLYGPPGSARSSRGNLNSFFLRKKKWVVLHGEDPWVLFTKEKGFIRQVLFFLDKITLNGFCLSLERVLYRILLFPVTLKLRSVFERRLPVKTVTALSSSNYLVKISRLVYKSSRRAHNLRYFKYLKDTINIMNLSFFFHKSELLSNYIAEIVMFKNRGFFGEVLKVKRLIPQFSAYYFSLAHKSSSLRIYILGKMRGQKARRFRRLIFNFGFKFSTQDVNLNLSYSLSQTCNIFGSFGVKVWLFKR
jgi:hypothetical protein